MNVRSLVNIERRIKFATAVFLSEYNIYCLQESWLNENIDSAELLLNDDYTIYRSDRPISNEQNAHGGSLIAVRNNLISEKIENPMPDSCVACKVRINTTEFVICSFYNPPKGSPYRYSIEDFQLLLKSIPKSYPVVICGDINLPDVNWKTLCSPHQEDELILDIFEDMMFRQVIEFPTCSDNTLDVAFHRNCNLFAELDHTFSYIYDVSDHQAIHLMLECSLMEKKPVMQNYRSFGSADYDGINDYLKANPFEPICYTDINNMCEEYYQYIDKALEIFVPRRTRHRQSLPPWISSFTSHLMKKLKTQKQQLQRKPTSYRQQQVARLEDLLIRSSEQDRIDYQEQLFETRKTDTIFKHLKSLNKTSRLPNLVIYEDRESTLPQEQVNMFNKYFHSVFSPKQKFSIEDIKCENPTLTNFNTSKLRIFEIMSELDTTKSRGPNGLPPALFKKSARNMCDCLHKLLRNIKRLRKIPDNWKVAAVSPIHKKGNRNKVENYRPISLLNIDSKILEKCIYIPLYKHFIKYLTRHQHGFVKKRSVMTNMLSFLKKIYEALDKDPHSDIVAFYTDFSKAFDKVPHLELLKKVAKIGVGGCLLEVLVDYLTNRKQYVRVENTSSDTLDVTSGVPQGSLLGPLLFCIFINDLPDVLVFCLPFIFADDLKILSIRASFWEIQDDLDAIEKWVKKNKMALAMDKCWKIIFRGRDRDFQLMDEKLKRSKTIKDLGILISEDLSWKAHIEERLKKANKVLYLLRRNVALKVRTHIKLGLYKSLILPVLLYGFSCVSASRAELHLLEKFQKKAVKWITGLKDQSYTSQMRLLNILPLPMFIQLNDILLLSKMNPENNPSLNMPELHEPDRRITDIFKLPNTRTEGARREFVFRTCRVANRLQKYIDLRDVQGLKAKLIQLMWKFVEERYSEVNVCTWQLFCDCHLCRNTWTLF